MKMNLDMSFEEGLSIVKALRECAINNGWDENELDECGVIDEYCRAVDAALTAMGISVSIDNEPKVEVEVEAEDEDENQYCDSAADCFFCNSDEEDDDFNSDDDEEENDDGHPYVLTPKGKFVIQYMEAGYPFEEALKVADILFGEGE